MSKRVGLVVNPTSGKNRGMALGLEVAQRMRAAGHDVVDLSDETYAAARDRALSLEYEANRDNPLDDLKACLAAIKEAIAKAS